jgi:hypothetical protein
MPSINGDEISIQFLRTSYCCGLSTTSKRMIYLLEDLDTLTPFQKKTLINRYITLTEEYYQRSFLFAIVFHGGRTIVTVGSLMVPALLSIQNTSVAGPQVGIAVYWLTWGLSLLVTMFNGILTLFKIDKKYYFLHSVLEHLNSEIWQYIHLTGNYDTHTIIPTHQNKFSHFCDAMEKLKLKQVEEEYYKVTSPTPKKKSELTSDTTISSATAPLLDTASTVDGADQEDTPKK